MKYTIKMHEKWNQPYSFTDLKQMCQYENSNAYAVQTADLCKKAARDLLDAPDKPLTAEDIKADFDSPNFRITEQQTNEIQAYYNGRLALLQQIYRDIDVSATGEFHYDIPEQYNRFSRIDDEYDKLCEQLEAYIELKIEE